MYGTKNILNVAKHFVRLNNNNITTRLLTSDTATVNVRSIFARHENIGLNRATPTLDHIIRHYAKGKDKKKEKGKSKIQIDESQIAQVLNVDTLRNQMQKSVDQLKDDFVKHLSLRSTTGSIENLVVNLDGTEHTLQELSQIVRKNPKTIVINMSVFPQAIPAALKAIGKSGMNLNPQQDGTTIYIPIPKVTKEHRENLSKNAKQLFIKFKDRVRDVQIKHVKQVKKKGDVSEDLVRNVENQVVAIADTFIAQGEDILKSKQKELLGND